MGDIYDAEAANQTLSIEVDISEVRKFVRWDDIDHLLIIYEGETDEWDVGFHEIEIFVRDNFDVAVIEGYVECADREYASEEERIRADCRDRVAGISAYTIKLEVAAEVFYGAVNIPSSVTEALYTYEG